jgi:hypothetical protein
VLTFFNFKPRQQRALCRLRIHFEHNFRKVFNKNPPFLSKVLKDFFESGTSIFGALNNEPYLLAVRQLKLKKVQFFPARFLFNFFKVIRLFLVH